MKKLVLAFFILSTHFVNAQSNLIALGDKHFKLGFQEYENALDLYLRAYDSNPDNAELCFKIGVCFFHLKQYENALYYLENAKKLNYEGKDLHFYLGRTYHLNSRFNEALKEYELVKNYYLNDEVKTTEVNQYINQCQSGIELSKHPIPVRKKSLGENINTEADEYNPIILKDGKTLLFTSRRENTTGGEIDLTDAQYYEDIYISTLSDSTWSKAENNLLLNTLTHDATGGYCPQQNILFIYRGKNGGDIYRVQLNQNNKFLTPIKIEEPVNSEVQETSACLSPDGNTLYFVSKRESSRDICQATKDASGNWTNIRPVPGFINTMYDEECIFLTDEGRTMFFSSKGHNSIGGYDIFKSELVEGKWSRPVNLGIPINTPYDDLFFTLSDDHTKAYYSTLVKNEQGMSFDIIEVEFLNQEEPKDTNIVFIEAPIQLTEFTGQVVDIETKQPLLSNIKITNLKTNEEIQSLSTNNNGEFSIKLPHNNNYEITFNADGYLFQTEQIKLSENQIPQQIRKTIELTKIRTGAKIVLRNIFFDFGKATIRKESLNELNRLVKFMKEMPNIKVEISGHTDNIGSAESNKILSEKRAKAVVDYLISHGIEPHRMIYKGYGFERPIAPNNTEVGRQLNRRTEFKILEY